MRSRELSRGELIRTDGERKLFAAYAGGIWGTFLKEKGSLLQMFGIVLIRSLFRFRRGKMMENELERSVFASGCFWGLQYQMDRMSGVVSTSVGYTGGSTENPTYREVCSGETGHAEAIEVTFDPAQVTYEALARLFFETHDPTQVNRQGPDVGTQYRSEIFYLSEEQKETAEKLIAQLDEKGLSVATRVTAATTFWKAEEDHQEYFEKAGQSPHCHIYKPLF